MFWSCCGNIFPVDNGHFTSQMVEYLVEVTVGKSKENWLILTFQHALIEVSSQFIPQKQKMCSPLCIYRHATDEAFCDPCHPSIIACRRDTVSCMDVWRFNASDNTTVNPGISYWLLFPPLTSSISLNNGALCWPASGLWLTRCILLQMDNTYGVSHLPQTVCVSDKKRLLPNSKAVAVR